MNGFLDVDGVFADFVSGVLRAHGIELAEYPEGCYDLHLCLGMTSEEFYAPCDREFWANLPWMPDGRQLLETVERTFGPENVWLLTSPIDGHTGDAAVPPWVGPTQANCAAGKIDWIERNMPAYRRRYFVAPKKEAAAGWGKVLVDDRDGNVADWRPFPAVLVPRPWNGLHPLAGTAVAHVEAAIRAIHPRHPDEIVG
jgi:hypothetical protein